MHKFLFYATQAILPCWLYAHRLSARATCQPPIHPQALKAVGYSWRFNKKTHEGSKNPDRNAQFEYIDEQAKAFIRVQQPVISIDTKKKELS